LVWSWDEKEAVALAWSQDKGDSVVEGTLPGRSGDNQKIPVGGLARHDSVTDIELAVAALRSDAGDDRSAAVLTKSEEEVRDKELTGPALHHEEVRGEEEVHGEEEVRDD
jgi:hypothetical protein